MTGQPDAKSGSLTPDELSDRDAGHHYEREDMSLTCICGAEWICPKWIEADHA